MNEKEMVIKCLEQFDTKQEKVAETLFNVYPDEMNAIVRLVKKCNLACVVGQSEQLFCPNCSSTDVFINVNGVSCICSDCLERWAK